MLTGFINVHSPLMLINKLTYPYHQIEVNICHHDIGLRALHDVKSFTKLNVTHRFKDQMFW